MKGGGRQSRIFRRTFRRKHTMNRFTLQIFPRLPDLNARGGPCKLRLTRLLRGSSFRPRRSSATYFHRATALRALFFFFRSLDLSHKIDHPSLSCTFCSLRQPYCASLWSLTAYTLAWIKFGASHYSPMNWHNLITSAPHTSNISNNFSKCPTPSVIRQTSSTGPT